MTPEGSFGGSIDPTARVRFIAAAETAGCEVEVMNVEDITGLSLQDGAVISQRALELYPALSGKATRAMSSPLVSFPQGVVAGELGIAETGSVLVVEEELSDRLVSMMSEDLVVLLRADGIETSLDAATEWLAGSRPMPRYVVLLTGPSRTADIERSLTIGVQGPSTTRIVLVEGQS
jgi:L-lactate dehydrogenase complex protein LldG